MQDQDLDCTRYSIKPLTQEHADEVFRLFKENFMQHEPLMEAYYKLHPERKEIEREILWDEERKQLMNEIIKRQISVGCFDLQNNQEIVGVILVKDSLIKRKVIPSNFTYLHHFLNLKDHLYKSLSPKFLEIVQSESIPTSQHWYFYIKTQHRGKGLLKRMVTRSDELAILANYTNSVCWASNCKTSKTMKNLGYELIGQANAKQLISKGILPFELITQEHKIQTLWLKRLQKNQGQ